MCQNGHAFWMFHIQTLKIFISSEDNIHIRHNIRILPSLSITHFVYKCLNIVLAGHTQFFGCSGKSGLCFSDSRSRSVADNNLPILLLENRILSPDFNPSCRLISTGTVICHLQKFSPDSYHSPFLFFRIQVFFTSVYIISSVSGKVNSSL